MEKTLFRALLLATTASLAAGALAAPAAALAAGTTTSLSSAEMAAALKAVAATTATAEIPGYAGDVTATFDSFSTTAVTTTLLHHPALLKATATGRQTGSVRFVADPAHGRGSFRSVIAGDGVTIGYGVGGKGEYVYLADPAERAAARMAGLPAARYVFQPDPKLTLDTWAGQNAPAPSDLIVQDPRHPGTRTVHDDGSADYTYTTDSATITYSADAGGVATGCTVASPAIDETFVFQYGAQSVTLPPSTQVISRATLTKALAYRTMARSVARVAGDITALVEEKAHGRNVTVTGVRKWGRVVVTGFNRSVEFTMVTVRNSARGVRIGAKNPYTGATSAYLVKAWGKHAVARKA
ncbi:hypothetical protein [Actinoplanes palleronii]|uniref:Uncharacterized protein n=1 Tax=Actinoplanes palleronii TaxID=113570 RepID=A0ABQ4BTD4_9ACTN|nr:hypothetical protein [Actinoplanes palleronii]GIE73943.1 hypothetical protein Apa02nite_100510 [Actinoplanes palleronii]